MRVDRAHRHQRGSVALLIALSMSSILIVVGGLVVDIGNQRVARRDMQAVADLVALDMSRLLDGTTGASTLTSSPTWTAALSRSVARNTNGAVAPTVTAVVGTVDASGVFSQVAGATVPSAVRVTAVRSVAFAFGIVGSGSAARSAVASSASTACFSLGSYAARISNSNNSTLLAKLLNGALGVNLSAVSYQGLAGGSISLASLATQLGVGTVDQLATASVTLRQLYLAEASILTANGDTARAAILSTLATSVTNSSSFSLGGVLGIVTGSGAAASASVDALDLVAGSATLVNGTNLLSIPSLATTIGLTGTSLTSTAKLIETAQYKCGKVGTTAHTSQADLTISGTMASLSTPSSLNGLTLTAGAGGTNIAVHLASATGQLTNVLCGSGTSASPQGIDVLTTSQLATVSSFDQTITLNGTIGNAGLLGSLLGGLGGVLSLSVSGTVKISFSTPQTANTQTVQWRHPPTAWDSPVSSGSGSLGLNTATASATWTSGPNVSVLGIITPLQKTTFVTNLVSNLVSGVLAPVVSAINTTLVDPLSQLLGVTLAGADVIAHQAPSCNTPALTG